MARGTGRYRVGLVAVAIGLPSFLALPFATVRSSRIVTGSGVSAWQALGPALATVVVGMWVLVAVLSLRDGGRRAALARGSLGAGIIVALIALSGWAATTIGNATGAFARVSIGGGVWASAIAAYTVLLASRRLVGKRTPIGLALGLVVPVALVGLLGSGHLSNLGMMKEYVNVRDRFWVEAVNTVVFAGASVAVAMVVGVWLGIAAFRDERLERPVFATVSVFQTVPGLAMVGLLVAPLAALSFAVPFLRNLGVGGIGWAPVVTALTLYALLAIVRNTYAGLRGVPAAVVDAGRGMGMSERQLMGKVRLPLAGPVLFSGIRTSTVQTIGNATLGAFVGGITLGRFIFEGLAEQAPDLTMLGSIALVVIALVVDATLRGTQGLLFGRRTLAEGDDS